MANEAACGRALSSAFVHKSSKQSQSDVVRHLEIVKASICLRLSVSQILEVGKQGDPFNEICRSVLSFTNLDTNPLVSR
jgi:hypothetical protein